ncbi:MAG: hypothetical protein NZ738_11005 [Oceanospirillaceae bacterium]|jgi:DNA-binding response OmpR family regulator|nr:hypothetical protein [Oceanospirillaceae bacterium]
MNFLLLVKCILILQQTVWKRVDSVKDKAYGITDYVHKPFSEDELWRVINTYV